jgi:hypothetical protein
MSGLSQVYEKKVLEVLVGKTALSTPTAYVALLTAVPTSADTGATITEATYTGYARKATAGSDWAAAVAGTPSSITNANAITFAACTAGTSTIVAFALVDSSTTGAGNVIAWGTVASTVVSATNTPASFAAGALIATAA